MHSPELNVELIQQTLAAIEANPDQWDQRACYFDFVGSRFTACFGGWALAVHTGVGLDGLNWEDYPDGMGLAAAQALGLEGPGARVIFQLGYPDNGPDCTFAELCEQVYQVTGVRYEPTAEPVASRGG